MPRGGWIGSLEISEIIAAVNQIRDWYYRRSVGTTEGSVIPVLGRYYRPNRDGLKGNFKCTTILAILLESKYEYKF
jgi:hypothetical protein